MAKIIHSIQTKFIVSFIVLILFVSCATFLYTYGETKNALVASTRDDMANSIGLIAQQFTPQEIQAMYQLQIGQENTTAYTALREKMQSMRALSPNIVNIYTMRIDNSKVTFIIDDLEEGTATIGEQYLEPPATLFTAINGVKTTDNIYTDEWGSFLTAYAPLKDSQGNIIIIAADMDAATVIQRENFIGETIYLIIGASIAVAALIVAYFSMTMIRDLKKLNKTAEQISEGNTNVSVDIKRKDEIGDLAESFSRMVASLKFMMSEKKQNDE
jgi:methyl-accepting chemotaxis protein